MPTLKEERTSARFRALPVQMIDSRESIILKRGSTEFKIGGAQAADVVRGVFAATADGGATADEICALFAAPNRPAIADLVQQLAARRLLVSAD